MKYLIIVLMLTVITAAANAQKVDTLSHNNPFIGSARFYIYTPPSLPNDTVRCSMLATDTTTKIAFQYEGYEVRSWHIAFEAEHNLNVHNKYSLHVAYLTKDLNPIPGDIIIWMSKEK